MSHRVTTGILLVTCLLISVSAAGLAQALREKAAASRPRPLQYLGFDKNDYPGDAALATLRKTFRFTSFWLNNPPQDSQNSWTGKRAILKQQGFGFLLLFNGRLDAQLQGQDAAALGAADGQAAVAAAAKEGFPPHVLIFLDQEEGGRLLAEQTAYLFAWVDAVRKAGARAGVYCSGVQEPDDNSTISTAQDIAQKEAARNTKQKLALWIVNDQCPPSPGCSVAQKDVSMTLETNLPGVVVWQFALTPRRAKFTAGCPNNYDPDKSCYAPGLPHSSNAYVDLDAADSSDPSSGR